MMQVMHTECKKCGTPMTEDNKLHRTRLSYGKQQAWFVCRACTGRAAPDGTEGPSRSHKKKAGLVSRYVPDPNDIDVQRARTERVLAIQRNPWLGTYMEKTA